MIEDGKSKMDNWKQFQGTELGPLMSQIYGGTRPQIDYPKPKIVKPFQPSQKYMPCKSKSSESMKSDKKCPKISIPRPVGSKAAESADSDVSSSVNPCLIDIIPKRRNMNIISKELAVIKMKQEYYRPAHTKAISSDSEKDRLSQIFEYKGGKILPDELTNPVSEAPFEIIERKKERDRIEAIKLKRGLITRQNKTIKTLSFSEQLAEQIASEIDERRRYVDEMKSNGHLSKSEENRLLSEIQQRITEYQNLEH